MVNTLFEEMRAEAEAVVRLGAPAARLVEERVGFMRYRGQGHEVAVRLPTDRLGPDGAERLRAAFEATYRELYGRVIPHLEVEVLTWTLALSEDRPLPGRLPEVAPAPAPDPIGRRRLVDPGTGAETEAAIHARAAMRPGARIEGPAVIAEAETSTLVPAGFTAALNAAGHIIIERVAA
jgi:N-methylhydantoinase A